MGAEEIRCEGDSLVVTSPVKFPDLCILCGAKSELQKNEIMNYVSPWIFLWIILSPLALIVAYYIARKELDITYGLCDPCGKKSNGWAVANKVSWMLFIVALVVRFNFEGGIYALPIVVTFLAALFTAAMQSNQLSVKYFLNPYFYIKGLKPEVRAKLCGS